MAQKPVIPKSRKTVERAKKPAAKDAVKKVEKAVGARGSTLGNIDSLVNKHLASFRNAEKRSRKQRRSFKPIAKNILNWRITSRKAPVERGIHIRENATNESEGLHKFHIRIRSGEQRYEVAGAEQHDYQQVNAATWTQRFKEQLAISIAKIVFAREAGQALK